MRHAERYVRARHLSTAEGRWSTANPLWPGESAYGYVGGRVTTTVDPSGRQGWRPPHNPQEDREYPFCKNRQPMSINPANLLETYGFWDCAACLKLNDVYSLASSYMASAVRRSVKGKSVWVPVGNDKGSHFVAGCLARLLCGNDCSRQIGSEFEEFQSELNGTRIGKPHDVSAGDALAVEDGWDAAARNTIWANPSVALSFCGRRREVPVVEGTTSVHEVLVGRRVARGMAPRFETMRRAMKWVGTALLVGSLSTAGVLWLALSATNLDPNPADFPPSEANGYLLGSGVQASVDTTIAVHYDPFRLLVECRSVTLDESYFDPPREPRTRRRALRESKDLRGWVEIAKLPRSGYLVGLIENPDTELTQEDFAREFADALRASSKTP